MPRSVVIIGVSAGGLGAVCTLLHRLPADFRMAIVVVQHRSKESDALCQVLAGCSALPVEEVMDKMPIEPAHVYLAPSDYHLLVEDGFFSLSTDAPELYSRPSIDVAFESAADSLGAAVVGVVLTGANHDGSRGLRHIVDAGGVGLVQDPATAEVAVMPTAAMRAVPEAEVFSLQAMVRRLLDLQPERLASRGTR